MPALAVYAAVSPAGQNVGKLMSVTNKSPNNFRLTFMAYFCSALHLKCALLQALVSTLGECGRPGQIAAARQIWWDNNNSFPCHFLWRFQRQPHSLLSFNERTPREGASALLWPPRIHCINSHMSRQNWILRCIKHIYFNLCKYSTTT